jgi:outer membrane protein TolC
MGIGLLCLLGMLAAPLAGRELTLDECIRLALANNPGMRIAHEGVKQTDARAREVVAGALPDFRLYAGYTRLSEVEPFTITLPTRPPVTETVSASIPNSYTGRLSIQQPLFTGLRLISGVHAAAVVARAARIDSARQRAALVLDVTGAYWNLFKAREAVRVVEKNLEMVSAHLADIRAAADTGMVIRNDLLKAEVQKSNVELLLIDARNAVQIAGTALANVTGLEFGTEVVPATLPDSSLADPGAGAGMEELVKVATAKRPEVKAQELRASAARDGIAAARAAWFPQIALTGNYYYSRPNPRIFPARDEFKSTWDVGVGANFAVWNWAAAGHQTAQAEAQHAQAQALLVQLKNAVALEVVQDELAWQRARERVRVTGQAMAQATENLQVALAGFKAGTIISSELLDAENGLLQAQLNQSQVRADLMLAQARLAKTLGQSD